jgi:hypothetical protein
VLLERQSALLPTRHNGPLMDVIGSQYCHTEAKMSSPSHSWEQRSDNGDNWVAELIEIFQA